MKILLISFAVLLFTTCHSTQSKINFSKITAKINDQEIEIVTIYNDMEKLISETEKEPSKGSDYYDEYLYTPIKEQYLNNAEFLELYETLKNFSGNMPALRKEIDSLQNSEILEQIIQNLRMICEYLPGPKTTIILLPMNPDMKDLYKKYNLIHMYTGITAITPGSGIIIISIDPLENEWERTLNFVIAHEYHHSVWMSRNFERKDLSLIEYLILEGRADAFAEFLFPEINVPWNSSLSTEKEQLVWKIIKDKLGLRDEKLNERIMTGDKDIPYLSGYFIGFKIVKNYMENHPNVSLMELMDLPPLEILRKSNYYLHNK